MGQRNQFQSQSAIQAPSAEQIGQRDQIMGLGQGQGSQARTSGTQGHVYASVPQAERTDQPDMQGSFLLLSVFFLYFIWIHHIHYCCILGDGFGLGG